MMKREKLVIAVTLTASCISLMLFAFVSLTRFLTNSDRLAIPLVDQLGVSLQSEAPSLQPEASTNPFTSSALSNQSDDKKVTPGMSQAPNKFKNSCNGVTEAYDTKESDLKRNNTSDKAVEECQHLATDNKPNRTPTEVSRNPR